VSVVGAAGTARARFMVLVGQVEDLAHSALSVAAEALALRFQRVCKGRVALQRAEGQPGLVVWVGWRPRLALKAGVLADASAPRSQDPWCMTPALTPALPPLRNSHNALEPTIDELPCAGRRVVGR
jgi:hypothetical protein